uniref:Zmp:0000000760 n=1 Tax=Cynoglossus semilaevis TaxID=244447 RepID=A0A3P8VS73_CYNSE
MLVFVGLFVFLGLVQCQKLPSYNLLEEFRVPKSKDVKKVNGSQPEAVAYRVNPSIHLRRTMSDVYPDGLPSDYSVIVTFKMTKDTAKRSWNLWQVSDPEGRDQVGLRFQGGMRSLDFFYTSPRGSRMLRTFSGVGKLFDGEWHKLALSVKGSQVKLLIDCEEVSVESIDGSRPVLHRGYTSIVKRATGDGSVSVDLQQMDVSCDPEQAYSEGCCELSSVCGGYAEIGLTAGRASCKCMHGQPGVQGKPGSHRGLPGQPGDQGRQGNWGIRGNTGDYGNVGEPGPKGEAGIKGEKGMRGLWGQVGDRGPKGLTGLKGAAGFKVRVPACSCSNVPLTVGYFYDFGIIGDPGIPGRDGDPGIEGPRGYKGSAGKPGRPGFIGPPGPSGHVGVSGKPGPKVGESGQLGPQGRRGRRGPAGPQGLSGSVGVKGVRGEAGPDGFSGLPGPPGPTLPAQHVIEVCKKVVLEQMSTFANSVKRTCAAVCPLYGDVPMGPPGSPGQRGPQGPPGDPGVDGEKGEVGVTGFHGEAGELGRKGEKGDRGEQGDKGAIGHGLPGYTGDQGQQGPRGRTGRAFNGQPGKPGERGHVGQPGLRGHPGLRGPPGVCVTSGCPLLNAARGTTQPVSAPRRQRTRP